MISRRHCLLAMTGSLWAASADLLRQWNQIARATDGTVGAAALHLETGKLVTMNGDESFPLASVCKLPIAMHILASVDEGKLRLDQSIEVLPRDVWSGVSDVEKRWPAERRFPLAELLELMVARSDNTAEETLFRIAGGAPPISARLKEWRISGMRIDRGERQCDLDRNGVANAPPADQWTDALLNRLVSQTSPAVRYQNTRQALVDKRDTSTPRATADLLAQAFRGKILYAASTARLIAILKATTTFPTRLKGLLPPGTVVAHKTGSIRAVAGLVAATNDSGVIFLPDGSRLAVSVYIKGSTRADDARDRVIAQISRASFDGWTKP